MAVTIGSARIDEHGKISGGAAGDQTGKELSTQNWYLHSKGWRVLRCKDPAKAEKIAACMEWACKNALIGYDQNQRGTLYSALKALAWDLAKLKTKVETDCSGLVRVCLANAGIFVSDFNTSNEAARLLASGEFVELTDSKYTKKSAYLRRGDVLVTRSKGHTVVVLTNGSNAEMNVPPPDASEPLKLGDRILKNGAVGADVLELQNALVELGYSVGSAGIDGEFGDDTEAAVKAFQRDHGLEVDGEAGEKTVAALCAAGSAEAPAPENALTVAPGEWNLRVGPGQQYAKIDTVKGGVKLAPVASDGWRLVKNGDTLCWISEKAIREG